jgi:hypothetical protein
MQQQQQQQQSLRQSSFMAPPCMETTTMTCDSSNAQPPSSSPEKAIRNLTHAFEALCEPLQSPSKDAPAPLISPTGVADHPNATQLPDFSMHADLQRDLTDPLVLRVSYYSLLHDINKEAAAMFAQDPLVKKSQTVSPSSRTEDSFLIASVLGTAESNVAPPLTVPTVAIIDEEQWLLSVIGQNRSSGIAQIKQCPPTFSQAMGEKEYENPVHAVTGHARTQLWKPSRSWWEAKSGKNPWIEPASHNKRWR